MTSQEVYIEDQVLDLSVAGALAKHPQPQPDVALDLSLSTSKQKSGQKNATSKMVQKRRRSNASDGDYTNKFGNYGLAGAPRTKRQLSLLLKRKEEEEEKARKHAEAQHSMEDLVHAEILISLKSGSKEENETESMELENGIEEVESEEKSVIRTEKIENSVKKISEQDAVKAEIMKEDDIDDKTEVVEEEEVASVDNVVYLELNDGSKVAVYKQVEIPPVEPEKTDHEEVKSRNSIPVVVDSLVETENVNVIQSELDGNSGKPYKCALCPQRFEDPTELLTHVSIHKTEYKCSVCTKVMTDKDVYLSHIESHLPTGKHGQICEVCNVHFSTVEELQKHVKSHESCTKLYKCGNCGKTFQTVKDCVNCEMCLLTKGTEKQAERKDTNIDIKVEGKDPGKTGDDDKTVNEKGAAGVSEAAVKISDTVKDSLKEKIVNTGQKNLRGEPAITPVAGSDHLTGIVNSNVTGKTYADSEQEDKPPRKCSTQESFELPMNCLDDDADEVTHKNVRNDVVDGENSGSMQENKKASNKVFPKKKKSVLDFMDKQLLLSGYMDGKHTKMSSNNVEYTVIKKEAFTNEKEVAKSNCDELFKIENKLPKTIFQKEEKCNDDTKNKHSYKGPIEEKIKQLVFHCGICDLKLHINDVESHLKIHRPSKLGKPCKEETLEEKRSCVICKENVPVKSFYTHWKSHSVYDLSQAQNLKLAQRTEAGRDGAGKCKMPFVCNLCSVKFTTFADLKLHVKTHLGPRIYNIDMEEKSDVLEKSKKAVAVNKDKGKKRKESDEKRITGKRPKGKRFKVNSKALKVKGEPVIAKNAKEDPKDIKEKTSPTIIAALQSRPKFSIKTEIQDKDSKHCVEQPSQSKQSGVSSVAQGSLLVLKNAADRSKEDESNVLKRKNTVKLEAIAPKKLKSTNENTLELNNSNENKLVDDVTKESNCNRFGACTQSIRQTQVFKPEPMDSASFNSPETLSTVVDDKSNLGTNAKPSTLHKLQRKILLFKEEGVKVARPVLSSVPATVLTSLQALLSSSRPVTCEAISEARAQAMQVGCVLTAEAQTTEKSKSQTISSVSVHGKNHSAKQESDVDVLAKQESSTDVLSVDKIVSPFSVSQPSPETKSVNSPVVLSASSQTYIVSTSSASSISAISQSPVAVQQSPMAYLPVSALAKSILQVHSSVVKSIAAVSVANLTSASQSVSLVGSLQNPTRYTAGMPLMSCNSKQTVTNVTSIKTVPSTITTSLNVPQQQQNQHSIMKSVIGRVNQPSVGNKPVMSPVLITQGGLQQAVPSTVKFPFSNIIYAPQTSSGSQTNDTVHTVDSTKPSSYQLLLLPLSQPVSQNLMKTSPTVTQAVSKPQSFNNLSLENTVLGAKLRASNKVLHQIKADQSNSTIPSGKAFPTQSVSAVIPTAAVVSSLDKDSPKEKVSVVSQASSNCSLPTSSNSSLRTLTNSPIPRSDDIRATSSKPAIQFIAGMSDNVLCITCVVCKQTLNNVEEMSTHVCKISFVSPSVITATSSAEEKKSGSLLDSAGNETKLGPRVIRRISPCQVTTVTTHSPQIPLALSTLPSSARSAKVIMTTSSSLSTRQVGVTSLVRDFPKQHAVEESSSTISSLSQASSSQSGEMSKLSQESQDSAQLLTKARLREFVLKTKSNAENNSSDVEEEITEPETGGDLEETMQSKDSSDVLMDDKDGVIEAGDSPKLFLQGASSSEQTLKGNTSSGVENVITLYPCVICNKTFTLENFRKHAKKHMVEADLTEEKGVMEDEVAALIEEENSAREDSLSRKESKPTEGSRKSDVYRCHFCFITYDDEKTLSQHYIKSHPSMTDYLCPADNCAQIFFEVQGCDMHYAFKHQHECRFCLQRFRTYVEFQAHIVQHYKKRNLRYFYCVKCRAHFSNKKAFYRHRRPMPPNKCADTYLEKHVNCQQCQCCSISFPSKECLKLHFKRKFYHGVTYKCCICREVISNEKEALNHMSGHFPTFDNKQVRFCHTCCIIFPYKSVLSHHLTSTDHIRAESLHQRLLEKYGQILKCDEFSGVPAHSVGKSVNINIGNEINSKNCENRSDSEPNEKSESLNDGGVYKGKRSQIQFTCEQCNVCFKTLFGLKQHRVINHMRVPPGRKRHSFSGRTDIKKYRRSRERKSIVCEFCSKRFHHISDLGKHINISHDVKAYLACKNPDCELNFNSYFEYEVHVCKNLPKGKEVGDISRTMVDAGQPSLKSMKDYMLQYYVEDCKELLEKLTGTVESIQEHLGDHFACQYCEKRLHSCGQLKCHLIHQHNDKLAQCVDCLEYFFHQSTLTEHRRECAVKGFSDEDFHTKKKLLGCDVCFNSFLYILGLAKYLRDLKFLSDKYKSSRTTCFSRKGVFDLKYEGECGIEEQSMVPFYNSRKFVCISCKNEYCNAEDFYICMKSRLTTEKNKLNEDTSKITSNDDTAGNTDDNLPLFGKAKIDLKNAFFCNECESIVCYQDGGICLASLKHPCSGSNTLI